MMKSLAIACLLAFLTTSSHAQTLEPDSEGFMSGIVDRAIDDYIRPSFARLAATTQDLQDTLSDYCEQPSESGLAAVHTQFGDVVEAWSAVEFLRFGPLIDDNRLERLYFWPDRRGLGLKRITQALREQEDDVASAQALAEKSVAVQGLGALDYLLYGAGSESLGDSTMSGRFRCGFAYAVATNMATISAELREDWANPDGYSALLKHPADDNPVYRTSLEAASEIRDAILEGLDIASDLKLKNALGEDPSRAIPKRSALWRSGQTFPALLANVDALQELLDTAGFAEGLPEEGRYLVNALPFEFSNVKRAIGAVDRPVEEAFTDPDLRGKLIYATIALDSLRDMIGDQMGAYLGFQPGFSSLDGD